jgi:hypothetical protein
MLQKTLPKAAALCGPVPAEQPSPSMALRAFHRSNRRGPVPPSATVRSTSVGGQAHLKHRQYPLEVLLDSPRTAVRRLASLRRKGYGRGLAFGLRERPREEFASLTARRSRACHAGRRARVSVVGRLCVCVCACQWLGG